MNKVVSFFSSMLVTGILLVIFAVSIAYATFIENDYGTVTAKILIYNALWFEALLGLLGINLIGSLFKYDLLNRRKWPVSLFHLSFVIILIGAAITRYYGYEGTMHIREGESSDFILSQSAYVIMEATDGNQTVREETKVMFSPNTANNFSESVELNGQTVEVENLQYMPSASETIVIDPLGEPLVSMITVTEEAGRSDFIMRVGDVKQIRNKTIGFETGTTDIQLTIEDGKLMISANDSLLLSGMMQTTEETIPPDTTLQIDNQKIYTLGELSFAVEQFFLRGKTQLVYSPPAQNRMMLPDALQTKITVGNESRDLVVFGTKGVKGEPYSTIVNGVNVSVTYGSKVVELPFSIYLEDFQLERYPGSNSPSSYASEVVLQDEELEKPYRIYMNNILKYEGYRFFQSSYDTDEKGTILSVNHDALGTTVTYIGYLIMTLGMIFTLFIKRSRFRALTRTTGKLSRERKKLLPLILLGLLFSGSVAAQSQPQTELLDKEHIQEFESLVVQSNQGRLEPVATLASEIMRKVAKEDEWDGLSPSEVYLDMMARPEAWKNVPIIKIANEELRSQLGVTSGKYATFNSIVLPQNMGGYRLGNLVQTAYEKSSNERNKFDKEVINVDERVNILMNVFTGNFLRIFPVPGDENHKWVSVNNLEDLGPEYREFARETLGGYLTSVSRRDWATADQLLVRLKDFQEQYGAQVIPSETKVKMEVLYQKWDIFSKLSKIFLFTGLILLILQLTAIFKPSFKISRLKQIAFIFVLILFLIETAGLAVRWYISGHAPMSNGYESMLYISWATCLAGLIFANRSEITLSMTTILAGLTLLVAGFSWMSPELTNLVPVLKSYWLIIHVAIITASYGFLGIGALLGMFNLVLMLARNSKNRYRINFTIKELVHITQISIIIGLFLLTIGSFLGGVWANESWGRYWGWDPKETWALVTIIVYTFVGHMHRIPGFKGHFALSTGALIAFGSVLMTYFGVNYYLSGLHSYAQGEPAPVPSGVYVAVILAFILIIAAFFSEQKMKQPEVETEVEE